ncbi:MAG: hypothetical protein HC819_22370 [Cyclobacteriaceae bacterium]|nr:hypothetical protein [Cyclobacteriaceae bacterium]
MKRLFIAISIFTILIFADKAFAQNENLNTEAKTLTYEELYDDPFDINKLFIHIQPMYGELFSTNTTMGLGLKAQYYMKM